MGEISFIIIMWTIQKARISCVSDFFLKKAIKILLNNKL
jgi:hypothetical protein